MFDVSIVNSTWKVLNRVWCNLPSALSGYSNPSLISPTPSKRKMRHKGFSLTGFWCLIIVTGILNEGTGNCSKITVITRKRQVVIFIFPRIQRRTVNHHICVVWRADGRVGGCFWEICPQVHGDISHWRLSVLWLAAGSNQSANITLPTMLREYESRGILCILNRIACMLPFIFWTARVINLVRSLEANIDNESHIPVNLALYR